MKKGAKKGFPNYFRKHWRLFSFVIMIIGATAVIVLFILPFPTKNNVVRPEELKNYVTEYLSEYRRLFEDNSHLMSPQVRDFSNFTLYYHYPTEVKGIISGTHGAAVLFNSSEERAFQVIRINRVSEAIEYYFWPSMPINTTGFPTVRISRSGGNIYDLTSPVIYSYGLLYIDPGAIVRYSGDGDAFRISGIGAIKIFGSLIYDDRMILKGSNDNEDWSITQARLDALSEFTWDCRGYMNTTTIETIDTRYRVPLLLSRIVARMESSRYRDNLALFEEDYEELKNAHAPDETLSKILYDYSEMQKNRSLSFSEQFSNFWNTYMTPIVTGAIGAIIASIATKKLIERGRAKNKKNSYNRTSSHTFGKKTRYRQLMVV